MRAGGWKRTFWCKYSHHLHAPAAGALVSNGKEKVDTQKSSIGWQCWQGPATGTRPL